MKDTENSTYYTSSILSCMKITLPLELFHEFKDQSGKRRKLALKRPHRGAGCACNHDVCGLVGHSVSPLPLRHPALDCARRILGCAAAFFKPLQHGGEIPTGTVFLLDEPRIERQRGRPEWRIGTGAGRGLRRGGQRGGERAADRERAVRRRRSGGGPAREGLRRGSGVREVGQVQQRVHIRSLQIRRAEGPLHSEIQQPAHHSYLVAQPRSKSQPAANCFRCHKARAQIGRAHV